MSDPASVSVTPVAIVLLPATIHAAPLSMVICAKSTNWLPMPLMVPVPTPDASTRVLLAPELPGGLPPSTVPMNTAFGWSIRRLA